MPYPRDWRLNITKVSDRNLLRETFLFGASWSEIAARLVRRLLRKTRVSPASVDVIGVHGQTLAHLPKPRPSFGHRVAATIQAGDLSRLAIRTGITVVGNFRTADLAVDGEGAPLAPHAHRLLFARPGHRIAVQNLGGIGNVTLLEGTRVALAFDTGPGNVWIDTVVRWKTGGRVAFDRDGRLARNGKPHPLFIRRLLAHTYFRRKPPKSTGWEELGPVYLKHHWQALKALSLQDAVSTVTHATAAATARAYTQHVLPVRKIILAGGGAKNRYLTSLFQNYLPDVPLLTSHAFGIGVDQLEALAFALLAVQTLRYRANTEPRATGARRAVVSGQIALGTDPHHIDRLKDLLLR
jgi:anhydro-N-acetylmuramic acid kinase